MDTYDNNNNKREASTASKSFGNELRSHQEKGLVSLKMSKQ